MIDRSIKKAMVLAAGLGTRLRPLTEVMPKPLVPIAGKPLLVYHIEQLAGLGVEEIAINLHYLPEQIQQSLGRGDRWGVKLHYSLEQPEILGTGGGLAQLEDFFAGEEAFYVVNGDILHEIDLEAAAERHFQSGAAATAITRPHPDDGKTGWIGVDGEGWVRRVPEMPEAGWQKRMFTGLHILSPALFPHLPKGFGCVLRTAYRALLEGGASIGSYFIGDAYWHDIGTPASYMQANWDQLERGGGEGPWIGEGARIGQGSSLGAKVIVGEGAKIGEGCELDEVVLWPGAQLGDQVKLSGAVVFGEQLLKL